MWLKGVLRESRTRWIQTWGYSLLPAPAPGKQSGVWGGKKSGRLPAALEDTTPLLTFPMPCPSLMFFSTSYMSLYEQPPVHCTMAGPREEAAAAAVAREASPLSSLLSSLPTSSPRSSQTLMHPQNIKGTSCRLPGSAPASWKWEGEVIICNQAPTSPGASHAGGPGTPLGEALPGKSIRVPRCSRKRGGGPLSKSQGSKYSPVPISQPLPVWV